MTDTDKEEIKKLIDNAYSLDSILHKIPEDPDGYPFDDMYRDMEVISQLSTMLSEEKEIDEKLLGRLPEEIQDNVRQLYSRILDEEEGDILIG